MYFCIPNKAAFSEGIYSIFALIRTSWFCFFFLLDSSSPQCYTVWIPAALSKLLPNAHKSLHQTIHYAYNSYDTRLVEIKTTFCRDKEVLNQCQQQISLLPFCTEFYLPQLHVIDGNRNTQNQWWQTIGMSYSGVERAPMKLCYTAKFEEASGSVAAIDTYFPLQGKKRELLWNTTTSVYSIPCSLRGHGDLWFQVLWGRQSLLLAAAVEY